MRNAVVPQGTKSAMGTSISNHGTAGVSCSSSSGIRQELVSQRLREHVGGERVGERVPGLPRRVLLERAREDVHEARLQQDRRRRHREVAARAVLRRRPAQPVQRPLGAERQEERPEQQHAKQLVGAVEDHRIARLQRHQQEPGDGGREARPVSDDERAALPPAPRGTAPPAPATLPVQQVQRTNASRSARTAARDASRGSTPASV